MKLIIGADHRGFELKQQVLQQLQGTDLEIIDLGAYELDPTDDYPLIGFNVANRIASEPDALGILLCGSGIGMTAAANKVRGVFASLLTSAAEAETDKREHNSNILVFHADSCDAQTIVDCLNTWRATEFGKGRHMRRVNQVKLFDRLRANPFTTSPLIVPTILTADSSELKRQYELFKQLFALINFDIIDPDFVEGQTVDFSEVLEVLKRAEQEQPELMFTVHLMVKDPKPLVERLSNLSNVYIVYIHHEAMLGDLAQTEWPFRLGITLNPVTGVEVVDTRPYTVVQLMAVEPGAQGKDVEQEVFAKASQLRERGYRGEIHFDGGVNKHTLGQFLAVSPQVLNVGSALTRAENPEAALAELIQTINLLTKSNESVQN